MDSCSIVERPDFGMFGNYAFAAGDIDGDSRAEFAMMSREGDYLLVLDREGYKAWDAFLANKNNWGTAPLVVADVNSDGKAEVLTGEDHGETPSVVVFDGGGQQIARLACPHGTPDYDGAIVDSIAVARRADGSSIVLALVNGGFLYAFEGLQSEAIWRSKISTHYFEHYLHVGDLDGDGSDEVAFTGSPGPGHDEDIRAWFNLIVHQVTLRDAGNRFSGWAGSPACPGFLGVAREFIPAWGSRRQTMKYLGWGVAITYQSQTAGGLDRDHLMRLLDEMAEYRMNLLEVWPYACGHYDPIHDGYAWPVQNPRLRHYWDSSSTNGSEDTEFVGEVISAAAERGIGIQFYMNWGLWNPDRIKRGYPSATLQVGRDGSSPGWLHCPDCPDVWQVGLDEVADLLSFYDHPNVVGYGFERVSYKRCEFCFCNYTQERYLLDNGSSIFDASDRQLMN